MSRAYGRTAKALSVLTTERNIAARDLKLARQEIAALQARVESQCHWLEAMGDELAQLDVFITDVREKVRYLNSEQWKHFPKGSTEKTLARLLEDYTSPAATEDQP